MLASFGVLVADGFLHDTWSDFVDKRLVSEADTVIFLESGDHIDPGQE